MSTEPGLYRLMTWLSPSYPVGAYAFSHGIEYAVESGQVRDGASAGAWITDLVELGNGRADLVFLREAWESAESPGELREIADYCLAYQATSELRTESLAQGRAFAAVTEQAWPHETLRRALEALGEGRPYPVIVGCVARAHGVAKESVMMAYAHAFVANLVSAAVRLVPLGQTDGQRLTAALEAAVDVAVRDAHALTRYTVSNATIMGDISSMQHECQYTRLFRS